MTPTLGEIKTAVASYYRLSLDEIEGPKRDRRIAHPRQVAFYLSKQMANASTVAIGRRYGGRDHTTVMHGLRAVKGRMDSDLAGEIEHIKRNMLRDPWITAVPFRHRGQE